MKKKKLFVKISLVPGKEYFLQFTPLSQVLSSIEESYEELEVWVEKGDESLIPIIGENKKEKIKKLKALLLELLNNNRIASVIPEESLLETLQS